MKKGYYLKSCSTCIRINKEIDAENRGVELQNIKTENITAQQLNEMAKLAGSYEALFSRKAMKYRSMGLNEKTLSENDYRQLILEEYTFLKRPVFILNGEIFIGNSKNNIEAVKTALNA